MFTVRSCFHSLRLIGKSEIIKIAYGKKNHWIFTPLHINTLTGTEKTLNQLFQGPF